MSWSKAIAAMGITTSTVVDAAIDDVFDWHARPGAFTRLTPPGQPLRLLREATSLSDGAAILRLPTGIHWTAQHRASGYHRPHQFVDELTTPGLRELIGWRHVHRFETVDSDHTRVIDELHARVPRCALAPLFEYRHCQLAADLHTQRWAQRLAPRPLTFAITGASGLIGSSLTALLTTGGHRVISLVRTPATQANRRRTTDPNERRWNPDDPADDLLDGVDVLIHLAGAPIAGRFTDSHLRRVRNSRVRPTELLAQVAANARARDAGPTVMISGSAVGFYGDDRGEAVLTEVTERGDGVIADIVADWESATTAACDAGLRVVTVRTGIVLSAGGGMLGAIRPLFLAGLGGRIGDGTQWLPWIGIDDVCDIFYRAGIDERLHGPVNAVAPHPVRNDEFTRTLGRALHRPTVITVPHIAASAALTERGARSLLLANQRVIPEALTAVAHSFRTPHLTEALEHQL